MWTWILGQDMQLLSKKADIEARVYLFSKYNAWLHQLMFKSIYQCSLVHYTLWSVRTTTFEEKKLVMLASFVEISLNTWHYQVSDSWYNILRVIRSMNLCSGGCLIKNCGSFEDHAWIILRLKCGFVPKWTLTANLERGKCFSSSDFLLYVLCHQCL